jgi:hypothetical protein
MHLNQQPAKDRSGWPITLDSLAWPNKLSGSMATVAVSLVILLGFIAILAIGWLLADLVSGDQKRASEAVKAALPILAAAIGLPLLIWRLRILDRQTRISEEKTQIDRETHYTSIFSRSIDQLGQTREIKRTITTEAGSFDTTTTVPNIEVRLGGIHSLSRLAEESSRDRDKIGNVLRSYIRENSWSDKTGQSPDKLLWPRHSPWNWAYDFGESTSAEAVQRRNTWTDEVKMQVTTLREWSKSLPETRVDVNEAADALEAQVKQIKEGSRSILYECIFVGRHFNPQFLLAIDFRRCTFVRCIFDVEKIPSLKILESTILDSRFLGEESHLAISGTQLWNTRFFRLQNSTIEISNCEGYTVRMPSTVAKLSLSDSSFFDFRLAGPVRQENGVVTLSIFDSSLANSRFRNLKLSSESELHILPSSEISMDQVDLSDVQIFDEEGLSSIKANAKTRHPDGLLRPENWAPYKEA